VFLLLLPARALGIERREPDGSTQSYEAYMIDAKIKDSGGACQDLAECGRGVLTSYVQAGHSSDAVTDFNIQRVKM